jgi:DNA-binding CsgD family transcriptional regulator
MLADARDRGAVMQVRYALARLSFADLVLGDWTKARAAADESLALSTDIGVPALGVPSIGWLTLLAALQGNPEYGTLRVQLDAAVARHQVGVFADGVQDLSRWAAGAHAANEGDAVGALRHLARMRLPALSRMAAVDRIEAAVRAGEQEQAARWVEELSDFADATRWPWALAVVDHGRALLADSVETPALFESALKHHEHGGRRYDEARTHLALGELLRRAQRRTDARAHLRTAAAILDELGAQPLLARAEQELRATGESARKRDPSTLTQLTPMELQIAQLVAGGMSNKEAAAHCWISPRTVAFHLRNVFSKTGISSRVELARLGLINLEPVSAGARRHLDADLARITGDAVSTGFHSVRGPSSQLCTAPQGGSVAGRNGRAC